VPGQPDRRRGRRGEHLDQRQRRTGAQVELQVEHAQHGHHEQRAELAQMDEQSVQHRDPA
jgi:hypothetical protein